MIRPPKRRWPILSGMSKEGMRGSGKQPPRRGREKIEEANSKISHRIPRIGSRWCAVEMGITHQPIRRAIWRNGSPRIFNGKLSKGSLSELSSPHAHLYGHVKAASSWMNENDTKRRNEFISKGRTVWKWQRGLMDFMADQPVEKEFRLPRIWVFIRRPQGDPILIRA